MNQQLVQREAGVLPVLTGVQAAARILVSQNQADSAEGHRTASFVSGYPGSPLAGLDLALGALHLADHDIVHTPALNEEMAATAVWGSQIELPTQDRAYDGVVGMWYGKSPGIDRASDAIRHGNLLGADSRGGVVLVAGDDPGAKSSSLPCTSERTLASLSVPVLYPRSVQEVVDLGRYGIALSRCTGMWSALKVVTDVADALMPYDAAATREIVSPEIEWNGKPWRYRQHLIASPPFNLEAEEDLLGPRTHALFEFLRANPRTTITGAARGWLGIVAAGKTHDDVVEALGRLGLDGSGLEQAGVRLLCTAVIWPLPPGEVLRFAASVDSILVVEEKSSFIELQIKDLLYGSSNPPDVVGKHDLDGTDLVPAHGELTPESLCGPLRRVLGRRLRLPEVREPRRRLPLLSVERTPYFCSGCPHNLSTVAPEGSLVGAGIGCHGMVVGMPQRQDAITGSTQMGGEGGHWIGQAPFHETGHLFQNVGDGTYFHSAQLAVQACVAADVHITFKLLYNAAIAMTGGQTVAGAIPIPELTHKLMAEGVSRTIICTESPKRYRRGLAVNAAAWPRERLAEAQIALRDTPGVTVLIYDQQCAAEARRLRKRGLQERPELRVVIDEDICEGCGDCGAKSNCLSVQPIETEFGRKTTIDQASCNSDYSCLAGDCPAFLTVRVPAGARVGDGSATVLVEAPEVPPPASTSPISHLDVVAVGIGGTGVVTVNRILAAAAAESGYLVQGVDQTGMSQKAGPVASHLRLSRSARIGASRVPSGGADCLLVFDALVGATERTLDRTDPSTTAAVVSISLVPTGAMVADAAVPAPDVEVLLERIGSATRVVESVDAAAIAGHLCGSTEVANLVVLGLACQSRALPLDPGAIEAAIEANGRSTYANLQAFRWGRAWFADPAAVESALSGAAEGPAAEPRGWSLLEASPLGGDTRRAVAVRIDRLFRYQGPRLARSYLRQVEAAWHAERAITSSTSYSEAVARGLHHLMAYKDEYEVARLIAEGGGLRSAAQQFPGARSARFRLHPPVLRSLGVTRKISVPGRSRALFRLLAVGRVVRGTPLDPFGYTSVRRLERSLRREYEGRIEELNVGLTPHSYEAATRVAAAAELVRGFEQVKVAAVERYRRETEVQMTAFRAAPRPH